LLSAEAAAVTGVDISADAIAHARARYGQRTNLSFEVADATKLPFADATFDAVVSFETLEHLEAQDELLAGFRRVLKPDGVLLISSPDKRVYSDLPGYRNEFHVRELYKPELLALLGRHFPALRVFGQKLVFQSMILADDGVLDSAGIATSADGGASLVHRSTLDPVYFVVACAAEERHLPKLPALHVFSDAEESVYRHYEHEIRKNMQAGQLLAERDRRIAELEAALAATSAAPAPAAPTPSPSPRPFWRRWF
jgi:SAM-dependent methyltransferase